MIVANRPTLALVGKSEKGGYTLCLISVDEFVGHQVSEVKKVQTNTGPIARPFDNSQDARDKFQFRAQCVSHDAIVVRALVWTRA